MRRALALLVLLAAAPALAEDAVFKPEELKAGLARGDSGSGPCEKPLAEAQEPVGTYDLGGGAKLIEIACWQAAYQAGSLLYVQDKAGAKLRQLSFQGWDEGKRKFASSWTLTLPDFDDSAKTLTSFNKARGAGGCGSVGQWRWTGRDFAMVAYWNKPHCDDGSFEPVGDPQPGDRRYRVFPKK